MRNIRLMLLVSGSLLAGVPLSPSAQAAVIRNVGVGGCLSAANDNAADSSPVALLPCFPELFQQWTFDSGEIIGPNGKCLRIPGAGNRAPVDYYHCDGSAEQRWYYSYGQIVGYNGMCLTVNELYVQPFVQTCIPYNGTYTPLQKWHIL